MFSRDVRRMCLRPVEQGSLGCWFIVVLIGCICAFDQRSLGDI